MTVKILYASILLFLTDISIASLMVFSVTPYYRNKLKGLYVTAKQDAETEAE